LKNQEQLEQEEEILLIKSRTKRKRTLNDLEEKPPDINIQVKERGKCLKKKPPDKISKKKVKEFVGKVYEKMIVSSSENQKEAKLCAGLRVSTEVTFKLYRTRDIILLMTKRLHDIISNSKEIMNLLHEEVPKVIVSQMILPSEEIPRVAVPQNDEEITEEMLKSHTQEIMKLLEEIRITQEALEEQRKQIDEMERLIELRNLNELVGRRPDKHAKESRQR
jgi:hypothetical protein